VDAVLDEEGGSVRERHLRAARNEAAVHEVADGRHGGEPTAWSALAFAAQ
jgi:hypothetical protein